MQKLLASKRKFVVAYFFNLIASSSPIRFYFRLLAGIFLIHFGSLLIQCADLTVLSNISPSINHWGLFKWLPWANAHIVLWVSLIPATLLLGLIAPFWSLLACSYMAYSLLAYFPIFLSYQWDILLIEVGICSLFFVSPLRLYFTKSPPSSVRMAQFLPLIFVIIRLFFHSGLVKLGSHDPYWMSQEALGIHLYSQPMPHYMAKISHYFILKWNIGPALVYLMFVMELIIPFGLLFHRYRQSAAWLLILFQISIILTGNFGYFNYLVIVPLILLTQLTPSHTYVPMSWRWPSWGISAVIIIFMINGISTLIAPKNPVPIRVPGFRPLWQPYGLFQNITTQQTRFTVAVSDDRKTWVPIHLRYFDQEGYPYLTVVQPYLPRIRWQLWFRFLMPIQYEPHWYRQFLYLMAQNKHPFTSIIHHPPQKAYRFLRTCHQPIAFAIDYSEVPSPHWVTLAPLNCRILDTYPQIPIVQTWVPE